MGNLKKCQFNKNYDLRQFVITDPQNKLGYTKLKEESSLVTALFMK